MLTEHLRWIPAFKVREKLAFCPCLARQGQRQVQQFPVCGARDGRHAGWPTWAGGIFESFCGPLERSIHLKRKVVFTVRWPAGHKQWPGPKSAEGGIHLALWGSLAPPLCHISLTNATTKQHKTFPGDNYPRKTAKINTKDARMMWWHPVNRGYERVNHRNTCHARTWNCSKLVGCIPRAPNPQDPDSTPRPEWAEWCEVFVRENTGREGKTSVLQPNHTSMVQTPFPPFCVKAKTFCETCLRPIWAKHGPIRVLLVATQLCDNTLNWYPKWFPQVPITQSS